MVGDAEAHAAEDAKFRELAETRNQADALIHATEKSLRELGDKVSGEERAKIESALADLKEADQGRQQGRDRDEAAARSARRRPGWRSACMRDQQPGRGGGPAGDQPAGGGNDNVVDAEFEEVKDDKRKDS